MQIDNFYIIQLKVNLNRTDIDHQSIKMNNPSDFVRLWTTADNSYDKLIYTFRFIKIQSNYIYNSIGSYIIYISKS